MINEKLTAYEDEFSFTLGEGPLAGNSGAQTTVDHRTHR
jgi:hypothetical protein